MTAVDNVQEPTCSVAERARAEEQMVLKSNCYRRADLDRLARLSSATSRTEASLLREALDDLLEKHRDER